MLKIANYLNVFKTGFKDGFVYNGDQCNLDISYIEYKNFYNYSIETGKFTRQAYTAVLSILR